MAGSRHVRSVEETAAVVDRVGLIAVWGKADLVLPSLWHEIAGADADWAIRNETGKPIGFSLEFERLWRLKDELPELRLACAGRHFGGTALLIAPRLVAAAYALTGRTGTPEDFRVEELEATERAVAEVVLENGPVTGPEIRRLLASDRKAVDRAVTRLQRRLVLTNAGAAEQAQGWRAIRQDLFARRWRKYLRRIPPEEEARRELALVVVKGAGEVSAADVGGALGWRRKETESLLTELANEGRLAERIEGDFRLWSSL